MRICRLNCPAKTFRPLDRLGSFPDSSGFVLVLGVLGLRTISGMVPIHSRVIAEFPRLLFCMLLTVYKKEIAMSRVARDDNSRLDLYVRLADKALIERAVALAQTDLTT